MCKNPKITYKIDDKILDLKKAKWIDEKAIKELNSYSIIPIKCGKCIECRKAKMLEMQKRLKKEFEISKEAYFLTLTYDNENIKKLNIRDMQLFIKKMRKQYKLKYFYVGELGETTRRPHYHCIIFAEMPKDLKETITTKKGYKQYESQIIQKIWNKGIIRISKLEKPLIAYITKYMLKNNKEDEFICKWSTKPPIGINEETIEKDILKTDRTQSLKKYYKYRKGSIPEIESEIENQKIKIDEIEKQTKLKFYDYLRKKRQN